MYNSFSRCLMVELCTLLGSINGPAQIIVQDKVIDDFSKLPIYNHLVEIQDGDTVYNSQFQHLEQIEIHSITYMSDGLRVKGHYLKPKAAGKFPCIIFNRGGNREFGMNNVGKLIFGLSELAAAGYMIAASQYRGVAGGEGIEEFGGSEVNDILVLVDAFNEIENADTSRIGMMGWSRGGMMTYIAMTKSDRLKAAAVGGAVSDLNAVVLDRPEMETNVAAELIPNYEENKVAELKKRSAIEWPDQFPKDVPLLIVHGTSDWRVKPDQSMRLALELEKERIPFRMIMYEGGDHGINEFRSEMMKEVRNWFDRYLKNDEPLPNMEYHGK